ncbi:MAG: 1-acyl-sn-glycerol-3-phosphate acyltransferase [Cyclobacteriaceae bacterium]|nr:1-acyl-sn-glycerol-3-phosphate acyltransferase [Cyclobacteriaceae bacterium]MDW8331016.1 lysophospholipid acyltransferase family protein [Cyclobacteriaceae bacterium]
MIQKLTSLLYTLWVILIFFLIMFLLLPFILIPFFLGIRFSFISYKFLWLWAWLFSKLTFIRYRIHGRENIPRDRALIFVSNHTSFLDVPGLRLLIPGEFRTIAKKELLKIPVFGLIVKAATVVVDRSDAESRKKSVELARSVIEKGISMLIFAEGTQNRTAEILQPFKDGAFRLAIETQTAVVPVVVTGAARLMPPGTLHIRPGTISITAGKPIEVNGLQQNDLPDLKNRTFELMKSMLLNKNSTP